VDVSIPQGKQLFGEGGHLLATVVVLSIRWKNILERKSLEENQLLDMVDVESGGMEAAVVGNAAIYAKDGEVAGSVAFSADVVSAEDDDDAILPKGQVDPVYEAKARVLNRAVRFSIFGEGFVS